jgi:hypothetical protein
MLGFYHLLTDIVHPVFFYTHKQVVATQNVSVHLATILGIGLLAVLVNGVTV